MPDQWEPEQLAALEKPLMCPDCPGRMRLKNSRYGLFYGCDRYPDCDTTHGAHKSTWRVGMPLGRPAPREVRMLRAQAHAAAAKLWNWQDRRQKNKFYVWLRHKMGLPPKEAHIAMMGKDQLDRLLVLLEKRKIYFEKQKPGGSNDKRESPPAATAGA